MESVYARRLRVRMSRRRVVINVVGEKGKEVVELQCTRQSRSDKREGWWEINASVAGPIAVWWGGNNARKPSTEVAGCGKAVLGVMALYQALEG